MKQWLATHAPAATAALALFLTAGCTEAPAAEGGAANAEPADPARAIIDAVAATNPDLADQLEEIHAATRRYMDVEGPSRRAISATP